MNILTDEELANIQNEKCDIRDFLDHSALCRAIEAAVMSKLAEQSGEPSAVDVMCDACGGSGYDKKDSNYGCAECNSTGFVQRRLYTEAQYLAAQQRTAEACARVAEDSEQGAVMSKYASIRECEAARHRAALIKDAIISGEWREYL